MATSGFTAWITVWHGAVASGRQPAWSWSGLVQEREPGAADGKVEGLQGKEERLLVFLLFSGFNFWGTVVDQVEKAGRQELRNMDRIRTSNRGRRW